MTRLHVSVRTWSILPCTQLLRVSNAHAKVGFEVLVQRMNMSNIQLCMCFPISVISCLKFEREQHPRHGLVVLVPCLNEALGGGDHLRSCQDMANFESWRVLGELCMEHLAEGLSHLVGLLGKRTDPYVGRHFVSVQAEEMLMLLYLWFFYDVFVGVTHSRAARFDDDHCRCSRLCRSYVNCLEHCVRITGQCHCIPSFWVGHAGALSTIVANSSDPSAGCSRTRGATSSSRFNRGY